MGEPTLLTVVITLGPTVISAVALWLTKQIWITTRHEKRPVGYGSRLNACPCVPIETSIFVLNHLSKILLAAGY